MSTDYKNVRLTESAYRSLERRKRGDESFSEVVERLARERPISDLAGALTDAEVEEARAAREGAYDEYATRRREEWGDDGSGGEGSGGGGDDAGVESDAGGGE